MTEGTTTDIFDRARSIAAAALVAAGAATIIGTLLDWVTLAPPELIPADQIPRTEPFSGLDTKSAPYLLIAAGIVILAALLLVVRRKTFYAWTGFLASVVIGAIGFQNYRGLEELSYDQMERIGEPAAAIGLMLVVAGGIVGVIAGAAGAVSIPPEDRAAETG